MINGSSHAYIIASQDAAARDKKALELACSFICEKQDQRPCMECISCKNAVAGFHPDIIEISRKTDDKGKQKRDIQVEQIRQMVLDAYIRPSQAEKKVYIIKDAGTMNVAAQNAALKILEEPPAHAVFILCSESSEALLATIRSRCVVMRIAGEKQEAESELAEEYIRLAVMADEAKLCSFFGRNEGMDSEKAGAFVSEVRLCLSSFLGMKRKYNGLTRENAYRLLSVYDRAEEYMRLNVGTKHIMGMLCVLTV